MGMEAEIAGIAYYLPENILHNDALAQIYDQWDSEKIYTKTGIKQRHIAGEELVSDMAVKACNTLFDSGVVKKEEIDFLLLCTQSPDYLLPTTACIVQDMLGLPKSCGALDYNLGCSGFVYGLALAKGLVKAGIAKNILLVTSETYSKHIHPMDKSTRTIFGDGAAACLVRYCESNGIGEFVLGTDGQGASNLVIPSGGLKLPRGSETSEVVVDEDGNCRSKENLYMNGPEIFNFTIKAVPSMIASTMERNGLSMESTDCFVLHQANKYMLEFLRKKTRIPQEKFYVHLELTGNTVSSSIPIALMMAHQEGAIKKGDKVVVAGFGVGYSWGATVIEWRM